MAKKTQAQETPEMGELLVDPKAKPNFWKPTTNGETKVGTLVSISPSGFGKSLSLDTAEGVVQIPVTIVLAKVPWDKHIGKTLMFTYEGTIKRYKTFKVQVINKTA